MIQDIYNIIMCLIIFCIVLFIYLHVQFHNKTSDDLEIYEIEDTSKDNLEELCDLRQPIIINNNENIDIIIKTTNKNTLYNSYPSFDIKIKDVQENDESLLSLHLADNLFQKDIDAKYYSNNNLEFITDTGTIKSMSYNDHFLRPSLVSNCYYDILLGSSKTTTPFKYELNYRNYFIVTQGEIHVKLSPPKYAKYLHQISDYENFDFFSPVNPWSIQNKYINDFDKVKCLDIVIKPGKILFIPAYWWYSFKFIDANSSISCFKYRTYMNNIAILPKIFLHTLQLQNIKHTLVENYIDGMTDVMTDNITTDNITTDNITTDNITTDKQ